MLILQEEIQEDEPEWVRQTGTMAIGPPPKTLHRLEPISETTTAEERKAVRMNELTISRPTTKIKHLKPIIGIKELGPHPNTRQFPATTNLSTSNLL